MEIKVYKLSFYHFDGVTWSEKMVNITALSKIQLMRAFLEEMTYSNDNVKAVWSKSVKQIEEDILKFPIIHYGYYEN